MASDTKHPTNGGGSPTHVVIVGGGFAGIGCARGLAGEDSVRVTLIDEHNYHQFQPLLYQVATSQLAATSIASSLRQTFHDYPNVDVKLGEVTQVDTATHTIRTRDGETISGDILVLAAGAQANFFNTPGAAQHTFPTTFVSVPLDSAPSRNSPQPVAPPDPVCTPIRTRNGRVDSPAHAPLRELAHRPRPQSQHAPSQTRHAHHRRSSSRQIHCEPRSRRGPSRHYERKLADGKTRNEALRCLKRRLSDVVFRQLVIDLEQPAAAPNTAAP